MVKGHKYCQWLRAKRDIHKEISVEVVEGKIYLHQDSTLRWLTAQKAINIVLPSGSGCWQKPPTHKDVHEILPSFCAKP